MTKLNPKIITILGVLCASFSSILVRYSTAPSLVIATYRLLWTVVILLPLILLKHIDEIKKLNPKDILLCALSGAFLALHFSAYFESLKHTTITNSTVLVSTEVIFCALGYALFLKGKIPKIGIISIFITFIGSVVITLGNSGTGSNAGYGNLLAILGAIFVSVYTLIGRVARSRISTFVYTFLVYSACSITLLILVFATSTPIIGYGIKEILIGLGLSVMCTLLGHSIFSWALKYVSPSYVSSAKLCEPAFATIMGILFLSEIPGIAQVFGGVVILGGVYMYSTVE